MQIENVPRISLANLPTPLEEMKRLSKFVGGPRLFIKRDDCTGLAFGGSKARNLEFSMVEAKTMKADVVITTGGIASGHSNWVRLVTAAARRLAMKPVIICPGEKPKEYDGNLLLDFIYDADIRFMQVDPSKLEVVMEKIAQEMRGRGYNPYIAHDYKYLPGIVGYANAMLELVNQANEMGINIDYTVNACGSGGTQAGLILGAKALNSGIEVLGISTYRDRADLVERTAKAANDLASFLSVMNLSINYNEVSVIDDYKEGYAVLNSDIMDAIKLMAKTEGILLDPVYTGKAFFGLIDLINKGYFSKSDTVVFFHTGGTPELFCYRNIIKSILED